MANPATKCSRSEVFSDWVFCKIIEAMMMSYFMSFDTLSMISFLVSMFVIILSVRFTTCLPQYREGSRTRMRFKKDQSVSTMVYWGSGGHTTEMIHLLNNLSCSKYQPMYFVQSHSDTTSADKISCAKLQCARHANSKTVYRSREVKQSWFSTVFTTLYSTIECLILILKIRPQLILCNGPGTCVPICYCAFLCRLFGIYQPTIVYVESFCRVKSLSLSGKLLYPIADKFIVQWPELTVKYSRAEHLGRIC